MKMFCSALRLLCPSWTLILETSCSLIFVKQYTYSWSNIVHACKLFLFKLHLLFINCILKLDYFQPGFCKTFFYATLLLVHIPTTFFFLIPLPHPSLTFNKFIPFLLYFQEYFIYSTLFLNCFGRQYACVWLFIQSYIALPFPSVAVFSHHFCASPCFSCHVNSITPLCFGLTYNILPLHSPPYTPPYKEILYFFPITAQY